MKARIENGEIKLYGSLPNDFAGVLNFPMSGTKVHQEHGFYDVISPDLDPAYHKLGNIYFDHELLVFTYHLVEIPIADVRLKLQREFESAKKQIRTELTEAVIDQLIEINREKLPDGLVSLYETLQSENQRVANEIENLAVTNPDRLRKYRIDQEDVKTIIANIRQFKS